MTQPWIQVLSERTPLKALLAQPHDEPARSTTHYDKLRAAFIEALYGDGALEALPRAAVNLFRRRHAGAGRGVMWTACSGRDVELDAGPPDAHAALVTAAVLVLSRTSSALAQAPDAASAAKHARLLSAARSLLRLARDTDPGDAPAGYSAAVVAYIDDLARGLQQNCFYAMAHAAGLGGATLLKRVFLAREHYDSASCVLEDRNVHLRAEARAALSAGAALSAFKHDAALTLHMLDTVRARLHENYTRRITLSMAGIALCGRLMDNLEGVETIVDKCTAALDASWWTARAEPAPARQLETLSERIVAAIEPYRAEFADTLEMAGVATELTPETARLVEAEISEDALLEGICNAQPDDVYDDQLTAHAATEDTREDPERPPSPVYSDSDSDSDSSGPSPGHRRAPERPVSRRRRFAHVI